MPILGFGSSSETDDNLLLISAKPRGVPLTGNIVKGQLYTFPADVKPREILRDLDELEMVSFRNHEHSVFRRVLVEVELNGLKSSIDYRMDASPVFTPFQSEPSMTTAWAYVRGKGSVNFSATLIEDGDYRKYLIQERLHGNAY